MNNEPVAWIPKGMTLLKPKDLTDCIPLYTHPADESFDRTASHMACEYVSYPAKTLTDEEIENIYWSLDSTGHDGTFSFIDFAREILRKAQEK
jgi:hypothetical protein